MSPPTKLARRLWEAIEPIHAVVYFAPQAIEAARRIGLRGFWMGYFASRMAPLGPVPAESVTAMAFGFAPTLVSRAIPDAWTYADPSTVVEARIASAADALRSRLEPGAEPQLAELADLLWNAIGGCGFGGRPLAAAWSGVPRPSDDIAAAWLATTILREYRGDGHVIAAVGAGLTGLDATVTFVASGAIAREDIQSHRGWNDHEWDVSASRLRAAGILEPTGQLTDKGVTLRSELEDLTDALAMGPIERLGRSRVMSAVDLATPISRDLIDSGTIPVPNPIGAPRP